jgi:CrcB protein
MNQIIAIALGGAVGAVARFLVANGIYAWLGRSFPFGTLFVNVSGSFLMGFLTALLLQRYTMYVEYRAGLLVGFLGAYTTFSTFALESFYLFEEGDLRKAALNLLLSVVLCLVAVWFGMLMGRKIFDNDAYRWLDELPYLEMLLGIMLAFLLATAVQIGFQRLNLTAEWRLIVLILLLGVLTVSLTLWFAFRLFHFELDLREILGIFITTNVLGMLVMWLGTHFGNWLWQLKLLQ